MKLGDPLPRRGFFGLVAALLGAPAVAKLAPGPGRRPCLVWPRGHGTNPIPTPGELSAWVRTGRMVSGEPTGGLSTFLKKAYAPQAFAPFENEITPMFRGRK